MATTAVVGALAVAQKLADRTGLVTDLPGLSGVVLPDFEDLVFGGHDIDPTPLPHRAELLADAGVVPTALVRMLAADLAGVDRRIRRVPPLPAGRQLEYAARISHDLREFRDREGCDRVVVVNVASTEPPLASSPAHADLAALETALRGDSPVLSLSSLYAYAAFRAGCSFVDFTPGAGARIPALGDLAEANGLPWAGSDGKTGETLVKSVLAPMFALRNLRVRSWAGTNLLGGGDGATLADERAAANKIASKGRLLGETLGYEVDAPLHIDYVPDLGDFKTAWDHISFEGFLGLRMSLQFTWHGCDSALAAPLVLDLARLLAQAHAAGRSGPQTPLGFFFKDPVGTDEHRLGAQYESLVAWATSLESGA
ncbi:inositol-3-phosphate synthase [Planosporangium flavigriseum]|uniref:Myo-inositol-1-phosphate synthase n=1 Tax=Planosporangium flavigriseum TaxID=373681 RepID=A0A8J3LT18_9ACTN|nr:myo-inositol-1-phosphate synthase [Planosporangium flavigriseum]